MPLDKLKLEKIKPEKFGDFDRVMREFLPHIMLNSNQIQELLNWEVGHKHRIVFDIIQDSKDIEPDGVVRGGFIVRSYKIIEKKDIEEMTDEEFGVHQGDELSKVVKSRDSSLSINIEKDVGY